MTVLNDLDRFHLVMDAIDRLPQIGDRGAYLKQELKDKLIEHKQYIDKHGKTCRRFATGSGAPLESPGAVVWLTAARDRRGAVRVSSREGAISPAA